MAKPELGTKRLCSGCGAKYYDLHRDPITCPKCGTIFEIATVVRTAKASKASVKEEEEEEDLESVELVSLEEADAEVEGDVAAVVVDDDDADDEIVDDEDDVFIEDEDEGDEDVPGIMVEREDEDADR